LVWRRRRRRRRRRGEEEDEEDEDKNKRRGGGGEEEEEEKKEELRKLWPVEYATFNKNKMYIQCFLVNKTNKRTEFQFYCY
jgi:hypothetical protein